jgi:hypothetical protein
MTELLAKVKQPSGSVAIKDAPMSILDKDEFVVEMPRQLADQLWDTQRDGRKVIYTIESNQEQVGNFDAIYAGYAPFVEDGEEMARASFVKSESV